MRRIVFIIAAVIAAVIVTASAPMGPAMAQEGCGDERPLATVVAEAEVVFLGRVDSVEDAGRMATFAVMAVWKGPDLPATVEVDGTVGAGVAQPRIFQVGGIYLVIPNNRFAPFADNACSATRIYRSTGLVIPQDLVEAVGSASARPPLDAAAGAEAESGGLPIGLGVIFVAIGLVILVAFLFPKLAGSGKQKTARGTLAELQGGTSPQARPVDEEEKRQRDISAKRFKRAKRRSRRW